MLRIYSLTPLVPLVLCTLLLTACAKTTVVLLPDENGVTGAVVVQAAGKQAMLQEADQRVEATPGGLSAVSRMSPEAVNKNFKPVLTALPEKTESILIYFDSESHQPNAESLRKLPQVVDLVQQRTAPSVELFGHTDHLGDKEYNQNLSDARAREVRRLLLKRGIPPEQINEKGFGDRDPLVPARPGKAEPRNRRVEIFIR